MISRRGFLAATGAAGLTGLAGASPVGAEQVGSIAPVQGLDRPGGAAAVLARDEAYWARVAAQYRIGDGYLNLEAGYFGVMAAPVLAEYHTQIDRVNRDSSYYARREGLRDVEAARARVARFLGAAPEEIAFTRGATEALQRLIMQYRPVRSGGSVIFADLDYASMQQAMRALAAERGAHVVALVIPEPATRASVLELYRDALLRAPTGSLLLLTHLNNKTGLIIPVREIVAMARERGVGVIVDAAHSFGQCDLTLADLDADFVGLNLHKWLGAPIGTGIMYIRRERLADIAPMLGDDGPADRIESRMHTGTANFANFLTVPAALDFHEAVGGAAKALRLRYLRDRWVDAVRDTPGLQLLVPDDPGMSAAITSLRRTGQRSKAENQALVTTLLERFDIFTVWRTGIAGGDCVRVTPALYNTPADLDRLAAALREVAAA